MLEIILFVLLRGIVTFGIVMEIYHVRKGGNIPYKYFYMVIGGILFTLFAQLLFVEPGFSAVWSFVNLLLIVTVLIGTNY